MNVFGDKGFYLAFSDYIFTLEVDRNKLSSYEYSQLIKKIGVVKD